MILCLAILIQYRHVTDRQTDRQTHASLFVYLLLICISQNGLILFSGWSRGNQTWCL